MGKISDFIKKNWEENQAGYARMEQEKERKKLAKQRKLENHNASVEKKSELWPYNNNIDISKLTRAEQHERELKIQMYMESYPFLPFSIGDSKLYKPNASWKTVSVTEQKVIMLALQELNHLVVDHYNNKNVITDLLPTGIYIPYGKLAFGYPKPMLADSLPRTFLEYRPLTNGGNHSKTPLIVHFTTISEHKKFLDNECHGELSYGLDGNVIHALVYIFKRNQCFTYEFGVVGRTFVVSKITTTSKKTGKKVIIYSSSWDFTLF